MSVPVFLSISDSDNDWNKKVDHCHQLEGFVEDEFCVRADHSIIAEMEQL